MYTLFQVCIIRITSSNPALFSCCSSWSVAVRLIKTIRKKNPALQLLLFSATFNDHIKAFAMKIAPTANHVFVPREELSLDVIKQYNVL